MVEELTDKRLIETILQKHFKTYKTSNDPFEKIAIYKNIEIEGIISYSIIYERAEINYIVVNEEKRKRGIGTKLLDYALNDIKKNNCQTVSLEVSTNNIPAINLYIKKGFTKKAIRKNYYDNENAILMVKTR